MNNPAVCWIWVGAENHSFVTDSSFPQRDKVSEFMNGVCNLDRLRRVGVVPVRFFLWRAVFREGRISQRLQLVLPFPSQPLGILAGPAERQTSGTHFPPRVCDSRRASQSSMAILMTLPSVRRSLVATASSFSRR